ncbi:MULTISPECIES: hypothetical protein [Flavobacteriaceae]|uniref:Uncharacterized protein n=2 Tax=Flavobacteriaceae TaxID=49546 RepID=A0A4Y8AUG8_9FLAO|nr:MULTISPECIES: hypothetical protein [Flavobacteriaceae]TEW75509.1 hypothetical protein E2488_08360 [Gramella jeungdoensis]GGK45806.1 hypothetical protein GCM10007963_12580 [Lutibacter litoralis]
MKKLIMLISIITFLLTSCNTQIKQEKELVTQQDTIKPIEKMKIIKEYDDDGNLISIDSSYYYFYSTIKNDTLLEKQFFNKFKNDFNPQFKSIDSLFKNDFLIKSPFNMHDFYTDDFYLNQFKFHNKQIEKIIKEMDSIKNKFYSNQKI